MIMIKKFFLLEKGHTIIEMIVSVIVFSLILIAIFEILNIGLKCWQLGDISTETQQSAEVAMKRIMGELKYSNTYTCECGIINDSEYVTFDTALNGGRVEYEFYSQTPIWQSHIIYYTIYDPDSFSNTKILFRRYIPHFNGPLPRAFTNMPLVKPFPDFLTDNTNVSGSDDEILKVVSRNVKKFEVIKDINNLITINLICSRSMGEKKMAYEQNFDKNIKTTINVSSSVAPRN